MKLSAKCQRLRILLLDAIIIVAASLRDTLESVVRKVARLRGCHKQRTDGATRLFGGAHVTPIRR